MTAQKLSDHLISLIAGVADHLPPSDRAVLLDQARAASVVDEEPGRVIDVTVPHPARRLTLPDGPIYPIPGVQVEGQFVAEILVWVRDGCLIGVEQPWVSDEPPDAWPEVTALHFTR